MKTNGRLRKRGAQQRIQHFFTNLVIRTTLQIEYRPEIITKITSYRRAQMCELQVLLGYYASNAQR